MKYLTGKNILLISPQPWDHIFISKHHYAIELARNDNQVYFLEPPGCHANNDINLKNHESIKNLYIVSWNTFFPRKIRFHLYYIYEALMYIQAKKIQKLINIKLDIVWSFDFNVFPNLSIFGNSMSIYHPVDPISNCRQVNIGKSADLIISVSDRILDSFSHYKFNKKKMMINHGLGKSFAELANDIGNKQSEEKIIGVNVGYFGNLDRKMMNMDVWERIVADNPNVIFNFWGPYDKTGNFNRTMGDYDNTRLLGRTEKSVLAREASKMDIFLLIYSQDDIESDRSNSHKILEYLATGKVIISSKIDRYVKLPSLVIMPQDGDDNKIPDIFSSALNNLVALNSLASINERKKYAQKFTYCENIKKIDEHLFKLTSVNP